MSKPLFFGGGAREENLLHMCKDDKLKSMQCPWGTVKFKQTAQLELQDELVVSCMSVALHVSHNCM